MKKPELLCPAGSFEKMTYAFAYGADAVYAGAPQFSLRARENAFDEEEVAKGVRYAHERGKKFYLTVNIVAHNRKIHTFLNKMERIVAAGADALIMADPGMIDLLKAKYPAVEIHLSVQANAMNWAAAKFWHRMGVSRIILSRELSIDEVKEIKDNAPEVSLEVFVHGAICIAHSGRCLLSNFFGYRDANDGCCTNACRWSYKTHFKEDASNQENVPGTDYRSVKGQYFLEESGRPGELMEIDEDEHGTYIMNAKDLMAIEHLQALMGAGVDSFKIEGRSKSIYYLALTTRSYRRALDDLVAGRPFDKATKEDLQKVHNRGYTAGFLINRADHELQRYEEGLTNIFTQEFAGVVVAVEKDRILVSPRNRLRVGDAIEIITPHKSIQTTVEKMSKSDDDSCVEAVHGGTDSQVWVPVKENIAGAMLTSGIATTDMALVSRVITEAPSISAEQVL